MIIRSTAFPLAVLIGSMMLISACNAAPPAASGTASPPAGTATAAPAENRL
jgi:hypothetical protein